MATKQTPQETPKPENTPAEKLAQEYAGYCWQLHYEKTSVERKLDDVVRSMERHLDDVKRMVQNYKADPDHSAMKTVTSIQHELLWGMANFGLDTLVSSAAELDCARQSAELLRPILATTPEADRTKSWVQLVESAERNY